jgi:hypothetical protein
MIGLQSVSVSESTLLDPAYLQRLTFAPAYGLVSDTLDAAAPSGDHFLGSILPTVGGGIRSPPVAIHSVYHLAASS